MASCFLVNIGRFEALKPRYPQAGRAAAAAWLCSMKSWLWVLPALVDRLQAIPVGIQDIGRIVTRVVVKPCPRLSVVAGTRRHCCPVEGMDLRLTAGHESNMNGLRFRAPLAH